MIELHRTEIDGVTTVWTAAPPPLRAGLFFRAGIVDETLTSSGCSHLIEHMVLAPLIDDAGRSNGVVSGAATGFFTVGQPEDICSFFSTVCGRLRSLPGEILESEKSVLGAELAARHYDFRAFLLTRRYGAAGYGLAGLRQLGFLKATLEGLTAICAEYFTRENAVLWLSGPPPEDLSLNLPAGRKVPLPPLLPIGEGFPSWYIDNQSGGVASGSTVPRLAPSTLMISILARRLRKNLRSDQSLSYAPGVFYERLSRDTAHLVLHADSDPKNSSKLTEEFGRIMEEIDQIGEDELEEAKREMRDHYIGDLAPPPDVIPLLEVQRAVEDWIFEREFEPHELIFEGAQKVRLEDMTDFARGIQGTAIFALQNGVALRPSFGTGIICPRPVVKGRWALSKDWPIQKEQLLHSREGVSILYRDGSSITATFADLAGAELTDDGGILLINPEGTFLAIEPTLWRGGKGISKLIRKRLPEDLVLRQFSRAPEEIPQPRTVLWQRMTLGRMDQLSPARKAVRILVILIYAVWIGWLLYSFLEILLD